MAMRTTSIPLSGLEMNQVMGSLAYSQRGTKQYVGWGEAAAAAFRTENSLGSTMADELGELENSVYDGEYNFMATLEEAEQEEVQPIFDELLRANNDTERDIIIGQYRREMADRATLAASGAKGLLASVGASISDPAMLPLFFLPFGAVGRGAGALRGAIQYGLYGAAEAGAQEYMLHRSQIARTHIESVFGIAGGAMVGGALGGMVGGSTKALVTQAKRANADIATAARGNGEALPKLSLDETTQDAGAAVTEFDNGDDFNAIMRISPLTRVLNSTNSEARRLANSLIAHNFYLPKNARGAGSDVAAETSVGREANQLAVSYITTTRRLWAEEGNSLVKTATGQGRRYAKFMEDVGRALRRDLSGENTHGFTPQVIEAAQRVRSDIIDPITKRYQALGLLPDDLAVKFADAYAPRKYRRRHIRKHRGRWDRITRNHFEQVTRKEMIDEATERATRETTERITRKATEEAEATVPKTFTPEARKSYIQGVVNKALKRAGRKGGVLTRAVSDAVAEVEQELSGGTLEQIARDRAIAATDNILNSPDGRATMSDGAYSNPDFLKERVLSINDIEMEEFLEDNADALLQGFIRRSVGDLHLRENFSGPDLQAELDSIRKAADDEIEKTSDPKIKRQLQKQRDQNITDLAAMRDHVLGNYAPGGQQHTWTTANRLLRAGTIMSLLGGMVFSALPDVPRAVMVNGYRNTMGGFATQFAALFRRRAAMTSNREIREMGIAAESMLATRVFALSLIDEPGSRINRAVGTFASATGMNLWNQTMKQVAAHSTNNLAWRTFRRIADGKAKPRELEKLAAMGIDKSDIPIMARLFREHGEDLYGSYMPNTARWGEGLEEGSAQYRTARRLANKYEDILANQVDSIIITPTFGDKPLFMSREGGATLMSLKNFFLAAHNKMLIQGLQDTKRGNARFVMGTMMAWGLGWLVEMGKLAQSGRLDEMDDYAVADHLRASIDRAGTVALFMELYNFLDGPLNWGGYGDDVRDAMGFNMEGNRMFNRSIAGQLFGPAVGLGFDVFEALDRTFDGNGFTDSDLHRFRRLMPMQNHLLMRYAFDWAERGIVEGADLKRTRRGRKTSGVTF